MNDISLYLCSMLPQRRDRHFNVLYLVRIKVLRRVTSAFLANLPNKKVILEGMCLLSSQNLRQDKRTHLLK
jgi:hypothetical protein